MGGMDLTAITLMLVGLAVGIALGWLLAGRRTPSDASAEATATAEREALRVERDTVRQERDALRVERDTAAGRAHAADAARIAAEATLAAERAAAADRQGDLEDRFRLLSAQVLEENRTAFLTVAEQRLELSRTQQVHELEERKKAVEQLVKPLTEQLTKVEQNLEATEHRRTRAFATLEEQLRAMGETGSLLRVETEQLKNALRRPEVRGAWGELQLKRVVELGGMLEHCDFDTQHTVGADDGRTQRPDLVVRLAGGRNLVVDAKVSLGAYFDAINAADAAVKEECLAAHARHVRTHVDQLAAKAYWQKLSPTPEFVIAFIPGEAMLAQALEADASLIEYAAGKRIMLAGPISLILMLRTAAYAWTETDFADNARKVFDEGRELHKRLGTMGDHLDKLGRSLTSSVQAYNKAVGSLERNVLPSARRMRDLKVSDADLDSPAAVDEPVRPLSAPELVESAEQGRAVIALPSPTGAGESDGDEAATLADDPDELDDLALSAALTEVAGPTRPAHGAGHA